MGNQCHQVRRLALAVAAGLADDLESEQARRHAARCEECGRQFSEAARLVSALRLDGEELRSPPRGAEEAIANHIAAFLQHDQIDLPAPAKTCQMPFRFVVLSGLILSVGATLIWRLSTLDSIGWLASGAALYAVAASVVVPLALLPQHLLEDEEW